METQVVKSDVELIIKDVMKRSKYGKRELCKQSPMSDMPPFLLAVYETPSNASADESEGSLEYQSRVGTSKAYSVGMIPLVHKEDVHDSLVDVISGIPMQEFTFLGVVVEGYARVGNDGKLPDDYERGDLKKDFSENPFSDVRETILVSGVDWNQDTYYNCATPYTYNDTGVPQFAETTFDKYEITEETPLGRFGDTLVKAVTFVKISTKVVGFHNLLTDAPADDEE